MKKHTDELSGTTVLEKIFNANINWRSYPPWVNWPRDSQKLDLYINEEEMYELLFSSQQPKAKEFKRYCCNVMFPQIRQQLTIQVIKYENVTLQSQRDVYQTQLQKFRDTIIHPKTRYVDHATDPSKDNIIIIVWKRTGPANDKFHDLPYYVTRIQ